MDKKYYNNKKLKFTTIKDDYKSTKDNDDFIIKDFNLQKCQLKY